MASTGTAEPLFHENPPLSQRLGAQSMAVGSSAGAEHSSSGTGPDAASRGRGLQGQRRAATVTT
eukprot:1074276-Pyramimonas_sp.AAC.1